MRRRSAAETAETHGAVLVAIGATPVGERSRVPSDDPRAGVARPAWELVGDLIRLVLPSLRRHGDADLVTAGLDRLRREGTGAVRQRRILERPGSVPVVLDRPTEATVRA